MTFPGRRDEQGTVVVLIALSTVMLFALVALVVDVGRARQYRRQAQAAADAASLAGALEMAVQPLAWDKVVTNVKRYAANNAGVASSAWVGCRDTYALTYLPDSPNNDACISADSSTGPARLRVRLPARRLAAVFALGSKGLEVSAAASAAVGIATSGGGGAGDGGACALCVLSPTDSSALKLSGNGGVTVTGGGVAVNSTASVASTLSGNGGLTAPWVGGPRAPDGFRVTGGGTYVPAPALRPAVPDPLARLAMCPAAGTPVPCPTNVVGNVSLSSQEVRTLSPGIYGTISASASASLTLLPGTYIVTGGFSLTGETKLQGTGVTLYFACGSYPTPCAAGGQKGAGFSLSGTGGLSLTAPTSGPFKGAVIVFDRTNTAASSLSGNGGSPTTGTVYMKSAALTLTGGGATSALNSLIVVATLTTSGNGALRVAYVPAQNAVPIIVGLSQ